MRLLLFSASIFYLLGLKLISNIEIVKPVLRCPVKIETKSITEPKTEIRENGSNSETIRKDTISFNEAKSSRITAPTPKDKEK